MVIVLNRYSRTYAMRQLFSTCFYFCWCVCKTNLDLFLFALLMNRSLPIYAYPSHCTPIPAIMNRPQKPRPLTSFLKLPKTKKNKNNTACVAAQKERDYLVVL